MRHRAIIGLVNFCDKRVEKKVQVAGSVTRPFRELKGFEKILLKAGETKTVQFSLQASDLAFYTRSMEFKAEPGDFVIYVGSNADAELKADFVLK